MNFIYETGSTLPPQSLAGGEATWGELASSSWRAAELAQNFNSGTAALEDAYSARIDDVFKATGIRLEHPLYVREQPAKPGYRQIGEIDRQAPARFQAALNDLAAKYPDKARNIRAQVPIETDAIQLARNAEQEYQIKRASRQDWGGFFADLSGGFMGSLRDPIQTGALLLGGGPGAARTVMGRIATTALTEAGVNAAVAAAIQPEVQAWREQAGLPNGIGEAMQNVLMAGTAAGLIGAGGRGLYEGGAALMRGALPDEAPLARALDGDIAEQARLLEPIRESLPPDARGALDHARTQIEIDSARPAGMPMETHDEAMTAALRFAEDPDTPVRLRDQPRAPAFRASDEIEKKFTDYFRGSGSLQPEKMAKALGTDTETAAKLLGRTYTEGGLRSIRDSRTGGTRYSRIPKAPDRPATFYEWLASKGGVQDQGGELRTMDLTARNTFTSSGPAVRKNGMTLDAAREAAVEAGYLREVVDGSEAITTVEDFVELMRRAAAGEKVEPIYSGNMAAYDEFNSKKAAEASTDEFEGRYEPNEQAFITEFGYDEWEALGAAGVKLDDIPDHVMGTVRILMAKDAEDFTTALARATGDAIKLVQREFSDEGIPDFDFDQDFTIGGFIASIQNARRMAGGSGQAGRAGGLAADAGPPGPEGAGGTAREFGPDDGEAYGPDVWTGESPLRIDDADREPDFMPPDPLPNEVPEPASVEMRQFADDLLAEYDADFRRMADEGGDFVVMTDDGPRAFSDAMADAKRPSELADLIDFCKVNS